jgi:phosphatidylglycerol:prolipoprotein diacylglycerol transferase
LFEPKIPYITLPEIPILPAMGGNDPITIKPFGTLVAIGVYAGWLIAHRQAKRLGFSIEKFSQMVSWVMAGGFIGGHVFDVLLYHPSRVFDAPLGDALKELLFIWRSQSSFGGFMGATLGMIAWKRRFRVASVLPYCDTVASSFPLGWAFGRTGCSVAHDHPGMRSDHWLAVQYPGGGRFDLGLIEVFITLPLALTFLVLMRRPRPWGFYIGAMSLYYAPIRFGLDFLRARDVRDPDVRHFGLTPAQWLCVLLFGVGAVFMARAVAAARRGDRPVYGGVGPDREPPEPGDGADDEGDEAEPGAEEVGPPSSTSEAAGTKGTPGA